MIKAAKKRIVIAFPPMRANADMKDAACGHFTISEKHLKESQFPEVVTVAPGVTVRRPSYWV